MDSREAITPNETSMDIRSMTTKSGHQAVSLDSVKCTADNLPLFLKHLDSCHALLAWLHVAGMPLLEQKEPLTHDEWKVLAEQCYLALVEMPQTKSLKLIYQLTIRKGISSLLSLSTTGLVSYEAAAPYFIDVAHELSPNRFGIGSHDCSIEESRFMIDSLVPIAQVWKSEEMLGTIAGCRFPGRDGLAREMMVKFGKNW